MKRFGALVAVAVIGFGLAGIDLSPSAFATSTAIAVTSSIGAPDRGDTGEAFDNNDATATYTTPGNNLQNPSYLYFSFASTKVNRLRILKDVYVGPHDLLITYSTTTETDLNSRAWAAVTNLTNGFQGTELMNANAVFGSSVLGDIQDYADGFASLSFDTVTATGIRIAFTNTDACCNHYHVFTLEPHYATELDTTTTTAAPTITLVAPNGGQRWARGTTKRIRWNFTDAKGSLMRVTLLRYGATVRVLTGQRDVGIGGKGFYDWAIPNDLPAGGGYKIRVVLKDTTIADVSDAPFMLTTVT